MQIKQIFKRNGKLIAVLSFLVFSCIYFFYKKQERQRDINVILTKPYITNGLVTNVQYVYKRGYKIEYSFTYKSQVINDNFYSPLSDKMKNLIIGKLFPVLANDDNPSLNDILIFPDDFKAFKLPFPDSLSWVK